MLATPVIARLSNPLRDSSIPAMSMLKTMAISLSESILTALRAEPPTAEFQRMIADSDKHTFEGVLVYQLDRFAHNRYDSAINKAKLKKNGVRVISARENISDDASGILSTVLEHR